MLFFIVFSTVCTIVCSNETVVHNLKDNIFFLFYKGSTVNDYVRLSYNNGLLVGNYAEFNKNRKTVFYFHGWTEKPSEHEESIDTIAGAFLIKNNVNFICLDYSELVQGSNNWKYYESVRNTTEIGTQIASYLNEFVVKVQPVNKIHLIGHSLGAQVMSKVAKKFKQRFPQISALDPAGPIFNLPFVSHLSKNDAEFLDVIHTDGYGYGDGRSLGHVDFYPNLGIRVQPHCRNDTTQLFCSHWASWRYYAESITNEYAFPAKKCDIHLFCSRFQIQSCCKKDAPVAFMGYGVSKEAKGDYFLKTNDRPPFGLGEDGFYF